jgi:hypothetical protein
MDSLLTVEVKSVGYQPQLFTLKSNVPQNKIVLNEKNNAEADDFAKARKNITKMPFAAVAC